MNVAPGISVSGGLFLLDIVRHGRSHIQLFLQLWQLVFNCESYFSEHLLEILPIFPLSRGSLGIDSAVYMAV